jgi:hypothetical protein
MSAKRAILMEVARRGRVEHRPARASDQRSVTSAPAVLYPAPEENA